MLGVDALEVRERWIGVYPTAAGGHLATAGDHLAVSAPFPGARVVEVISGLGMTMALGAAVACSTTSSVRRAACGEPRARQR